MAHRLFIAIDLPDGVKRLLARLVRFPPGGVRPVPTEQMHLTLHFLGDVEEESATRLAEALRAVRLESFTIDLLGVGCFPSPRRPTVLWVGVQPSGPLSALHSAIHDVLVACGLPTEDRPFTPHVTLARLKPRVPRSWTAAFLAAHADLFAAAIPAKTFTLFRSQHTDDGHEHAIVATYQLGS